MYWITQRNCISHQCKRKYNFLIRIFLSDLMMKFQPNLILDKKKYALLGILLPVLFVLFLYCLFEGDIYPLGDGALYYLATQKIHLALENGGWGSWLYGSYMYRTVQPLFFTTVAAPFLALTRGDISLAVQAVNICCYLFFVWNLYRIFRLFVGRVSAVIFVNIVASIPWILMQNLSFSPETFFLPCALGALYHFIQADDLTGKRHTRWFFFYLAMTLMFRPVITILYVSGPLMFGLYRSFRKKVISLSDILFVLVYFVLLPTLTISCTHDFTLFESFFVFMLLPVIYPTMVWMASRSLWTDVKGWTLICYVLSVGWYLGDLETLRGWVSSTTINEQLAAFDNNIDQSFLTFIKNLFFELGGYLFIVLCLLSAVALFGLYFKYRNTIKSKIKIKKVELLWVFVFPVVVGFLSYNNGTRFYYFGVILFYIFVLIFLERNLKRVFLYPTLLLGMFVAYFINYGFVSPNGQKYAPRLLNLLTSDGSILYSRLELIYDYISPGKDVTFQIAEGISKIPNYDVRATWGWLGLRSDNVAFAFDPRVLQLRVAELTKKMFYMEEVPLYDRGEIDPMSYIESIGFRYLLIGPTDGATQSKLSNREIQRKNFFERYGAKRLHTFKVFASGSPLTYVVVEIPRSASPLERVE